MAATFQQTLQSLLSHPNAHINSLDCLTEADRERLERWNAKIPLPTNECIHSLISNTSSSRPGHEAIHAWDLDMTYIELDEASSALAVELVRCGVSENSFLPFCFEKSGFAVVAILATLKAGAICVPLEPTHPFDYSHSIVESVDAPLVLCSKLHMELAKNLAKGYLTVDSATLQRLVHTVNRNIDLPAVTPDASAYVIFTSGSTGAAKGSVIDHRALCSSMLSHGPALRIRPDSRVLQFASYVFDLSVCEILTTLTMGGCICVPRDEERLEHLEEAITRMEANWAFMTPTMCRQLSPSKVPTLQTLVSGGEAIGQDNVRKWGRALDFFLGYGPSETGVFCSASQANVDPNNETPSLSLGSPIGSALWLTEPRNPNKLVSIGSVGEILVEGPILGRGYVNDQGRTDAAFIHDPAWSRCIGPRMATRRFYRTGDLARQMSDSTLHFVGRRDATVKIRGMRLVSRPGFALLRRVMGQ